MSDDRALTERLRAALATAGAEAKPTAACPDPARIWAAATGGLRAGEARELVDHASTCQACAFAWRLAHEVGVEAGEVAAAAPAPAAAIAGFHWRPTVLAAGLLLAALAGAFLALQFGMRGTGGAATRWADLAVTPAPVAAETGGLVWRGEAVIDNELATALEPYLRGDWPAAERVLSAFTAAHPADGRGTFYLGVTLLLLGRPGEAATRLEEVGRLDGVGAEERDWYLAIALLKSGREADALTPLGRLAAAQVPHRAEALALRERVRAALGQRE